MRKLSKKISMLMVLAMLVSLFSGIVSASAASAWSFKSSKYDVEVGETIEMEKNEYADFDLFKNDAAPAGYTVKWESSNPDAVWVNAKTGQLRADKFKTADYGDKATISATFTNTATKKSATRSFVIVVAEGTEYEITVNFGDEALAVGQKYDLAAVVKADGVAVEAKVAFAIDGKAIDAAYTPAEEGEFTIVTTATIDGKVVATAKTPVVVAKNVPEIAAAKQVASNAVAITFTDAAWAKKAAESLNAFKVTYKSNDQDITDYIKSIAVSADDAKTAVVTLYNDLTEKVAYTYEFVGYDCAVTVVGADAKPVRIEVVGGKIPVADTSDAAKLGIKAYNSIGADITNKVLATYFVSYTPSDYSVCNINGDKIYFFEAGKSAVVTAELEMGYDEAGVKIPNLKATGTYTSVPTFTDAPFKSFKLDDANDNWWVDYGTSLKNIAVGDATGSKILYGKFVRTYADGHTEDVVVVNGAGGNNTGYTYYSSNEAVALIDQLNGIVKPGSAGTTTLYVKNANGQVVGSVLVTVAPNRELTTMTASANTGKLSTGTAAVANDKVEVSLSAKDQIGDGIGVTYQIKLESPKNGKTLNDYFTGLANVDANGFVSVTPDANGKIYLTGNAANLNDKEMVQLTVKVVATENARSWVKKDATVTFVLKNVNNEYTASNLLNIDKTNVDTKLSNKQDEMWKYNINIGVIGKDSAQFHTIDNAFNTIADKNAASAATGVYSLYVENPDGNAYTAVNNGLTSYTINTVTVANGVVSKIKSGSYKVFLYKGDGRQAQQVGYQVINVTDSTPALTASATTAKIASFTDADVLGALKFYRNGNETTWNVNTNQAGTAVNSVNTTENGYNRLYVQKVIVYTKASEILGYSWDGLYVRNEVNVGQLFYLQ